MKVIRGYLERKKRNIELRTRPEKIEEIRQVWTSPMFRTHNQRLTYLLRHCKSTEYGYTIREFANAIHPHRMTGPDAEEDGKYYAFAALHKMFNRYKKDFQNHEVLLGSIPVKGIWYHYNIIDDEEAKKQNILRASRVALGLTRALQRLEYIAEHPEEAERALQECLAENERIQNSENERIHIQKQKAQVDRKAESESKSKSKPAPKPDKYQRRLM